MQTYTPEFYDLVTSGLGSLDKFQSYLDTVMANKYNGLQLDGFAFAPNMQLDFTYTQVQTELGLNVMATYVDLDSDPLPIGSRGMELTTGKIPRMKMRMEFNEDDARKRLLVSKWGTDGNAAVNAAKNQLFTTMDELIGGHTNSLTYQRHQMVSAGALTLTDANNPRRGITDVTFSANIPDANKKTLTSTARWFTNDDYTTEGTASDPIKDGKDMVKKAKDKGLRAMHFEMNVDFAEAVVNHSKVRTAIGYYTYPLATDATAAQNAVQYMDNDQRINILGRIWGAPIKTIDSVVAVEKWDNTQKKLVRPQMDAFNSNVLVLVPDGSLGEVLTVEPLKLPVTSGTYGSFYGGRLLTTVDYDIMKKIQYFQTEMTSLVVPNKPQLMFYLFTK